MLCIEFVLRVEIIYFAKCRQEDSKRDTRLSGALKMMTFAKIWRGVV